MKATLETQRKAKAAGIKSWHVKSEEKLQEELGTVQEPVVEVVEEVQEEKIDVEELLDLMDGGTFGNALMSAKMNGPKSKFWKFRHYLEKRVNGN